MGLISGQVERRLSSMLGVDVTFDKLNLSVLGGSVEAQGVTVAAADPATPLLTVRRVRAEISLGAALKKEFVVKSLTIEKPVLTVVRGADGKLNLPPRTPKTEAPTKPDDGNAESWKLDAKKVLVVDAEVHYRDARTGYHASIEQLLAELKEAAGGFEFTLIADSVARRDEPVSVGQLKLTGIAANMPSLLQWQRARLHGSFELGEMLKGKFEVPSLKPAELKTQLDGNFNFDQLRRLLPSSR